MGLRRIGPRRDPDRHLHTRITRPNGNPSAAAPPEGFPPSAIEDVRAAADLVRAVIADAQLSGHHHAVWYCGVHGVSVLVVMRMQALKARLDEVEVGYM